MSFRQFGGLNRNATNNYISSNTNVSSGLYITDGIGQYKSYVNAYSDISSNYTGPQGDSFWGLTGQGGGATAVYYNGNVIAVAFYATSDYRIKKDVTKLDDSFTIDNINPITYTNLQTGKKDIGFLAHEVQEIYPYLVKGQKNGKDLQSINYTGLIPILIKEIKDLKNEVKDLKTKLNL